MSVIFFDSPQAIDITTADDDASDVSRYANDSGSFGVWNATMAGGGSRNVTEGYHYSHLFGSEIAIPEWEAVLTILSLRYYISYTNILREKNT